MKKLLPEKNKKIINKIFDAFPEHKMPNKYKIYYEKKTLKIFFSDFIQEIQKKKVIQKLIFYMIFLIVTNTFL